MSYECFNFAFSIVLAALASATAPASTMMTIRQTGAKRDFVNTLLQVVALDNVVGLVEYSVAISVALASISGRGGFNLQNRGGCGRRLSRPAPARCAGGHER